VSKQRLAIQPTAKRKAHAVIFILTFLYDFFLLFFLLVNEAEPTDFNDLGKMLLGGFALAIAVAVLLVFVKLRFRDKNPQKADFISISNVTDKE
jgi:hypothetical protein